MNQEKFSGYGGYHANRIWAAIYKENCFLREDPDSGVGECFEERVLYRLFSGLHGSITAHVCNRYSHDPATGAWLPNPEDFQCKLGQHPDYMRNIYFAFLFLLRAASHSAPFLVDTYEYTTGNPQEEGETREAMRKLFEEPLLNGCFETFDESLMFQSTLGGGGDEEGGGEKARLATLREQMRKKFYNVSEILDCVGCDTCKVNGKMQILAIGTALKILLAENNAQRQNTIQHLQRNEIIVRCMLCVVCCVLCVVYVVCVFAQALIAII
mgnify:FL=1